jgi:hypothetical protein
MESSREDRYEAAVRAALDLCDEVEDEANVDLTGGMVDPMELRRVIRDALLIDDEEGMP